MPTQLHTIGKVLAYLKTDKHFKNNSKGARQEPFFKYLLRRKSVVSSTTYYFFGEKARYFRYG